MWQEMKLSIPMPSSTTVVINSSAAYVEFLNRSGGADGGYRLVGRVAAVV